MEDIGSQSVVLATEKNSVEASEANVMAGLNVALMPSARGFVLHPMMLAHGNHVSVLSNAELGAIGAYSIFDD